MGWSSANTIFNAVARSLIETDAEDLVVTVTLGRLIEILRDGGWDGEAESLEIFRNYPPVVEAFRRQGITLG